MATLCHEGSGCWRQHPVAQLHEAVTGPQPVARVWQQDDQAVLDLVFDPHEHRAADGVAPGDDALRAADRLDFPCRH